MRNRTRALRRHHARRIKKKVLIIWNFFDKWCWNGDDKRQSKKKKVDLKEQKRLAGDYDVEVQEMESHLAILDEFDLGDK